MKVRCPTCKKEVVWKDMPSTRPFCSERCRLLDLGDWAMGKHAIPGDHQTDEDDKSPKESGDPNKED